MDKKHLNYGNITLLITIIVMAYVIIKLSIVFNISIEDIFKTLLI